MDTCQPLRLWYRQSAPCVNDFVEEYTREVGENPLSGWEKWSLPIGNGYMGVNVFGRTQTERLQITENSLANPGCIVSEDEMGLNNFCELLIDFFHDQPENYLRELSLDEGMARTSYTFGGVEYSREIFTSYPDRVLVIRLTASQPEALSFTMRPTIPFLQEKKDRSKRGTVRAEGDLVTMSGEMEGYAVQFEGQFRVFPEGGVLETLPNAIRVRNADSATIVAAIGTNYRMESRVFTEPDPHKKLAPYPHPHEMVSEILAKACAYDYETLRARHLADYQELFGRVSLCLGTEGADMPTDELLERYRGGEKLPYLEALYFQYGRYLLISCSRKGALPANLQGVWNCYNYSPWGAGYWHNINVQMNYWPAFVTNLAETFDSYADYAAAYMPQAERMADEYVRVFAPDKLEKPGQNGWTIGTASYPYYVDSSMRFRNGKYTIGHSGPGTGAFTSILFWEWYAFTQDRDALEKAFSILRSMAQFLSKTVEEVDGKFLVKESASPEQTVIVGKEWIYYHTVGCAFDQQMLYENYYDLLRAAHLLGKEDDPVVRIAREQIDHLDPVQVGVSGQIKEYREEQAYGEIGEWHHRHISHLVGLYPGSCINRNTQAWMEAARVTLNLRGDESTGWAMAHRLNAWARAMDGNRAYRLYRTLLSKGTFPNLWDAHPPFQIDGNFGGTSGVSEMLLQSQAGFIDVLPSLPDAWAEGCFKGLVARGNVVVDVCWDQGRAREIVLTARVDGEIAVRCDRMDAPALYGEDGVCLAMPDADGMLRTELKRGQRVWMRSRA